MLDLGGWMAEVGGGGRGRRLGGEGEEGRHDSQPLFQSSLVARPEISRSDHRDGIEGDGEIL
jgi:hypothetical protein